MNTGAHPDDETSAMLAAMAFRDGVDISYACSTRGEGGQNDIGTEATEALGVLRTAEMERACDALGLRMYWLSQSPDDSIFDFGFSKSGTETMGKWGRERTLARFVDILRTERPDIICPTFLDVPGQHGHHRAMTEAAHQVMDLSADPAFEGSDLPVWQVKKLYLPAFSGAGQAYDDDLPPPPATLVIDAKGADPVTGFTFEQIGQQSRVFHATQAMGRWIAAGEERDWPLHLADSRVAGPDEDLASGLARDLRDLGLPEVQDHMDAAIESFPDMDGILRHASAALGALQGVTGPEGQEHKISRKREQLAHVIRLASGAAVHARLDRDQVLPSDSLEARVEVSGGVNAEVTTGFALPRGWSAEGTRLQTKDAPLSDPYPDTYLPGEPAGPSVELTLSAHGVESRTRHAFEVPPMVLPALRGDLSPLADVVNIAAENRLIRVDLGNCTPANTEPSLSLPKGWTAARDETGFDMTAPDDVAPGRYALTLMLDGTPAQSVRQIAYDHIAPRALIRPAQVEVQVLNVALPKARIGYLGGGNDRVSHWLERAGLAVAELSIEDLYSETKLAQFDSILIGIFAIRFREGLSDAMPHLHDWARAGGNLVTLYHRPWDNWDAETTAPERLEIGQPSLRWRVTDENAEVTHLSDHPVLSHPNPIGAAEWAGWHKERGLYFAKSWDAAYEPLLEMSDPDETPHKGALLAAKIGKGRHIHCALILHHQMEKLVPGGFALMMNLLAKPT
ncbi:PIG-L family deacetylase [Harenicola maris]